MRCNVSETGEAAFEGPLPPPPLQEEKNHFERADRQDVFAGWLNWNTNISIFLSQPAATHFAYSD